MNEYPISDIQYASASFCTPFHALTFTVRSTEATCTVTHAGYWIQVSSILTHPATGWQRHRTKEIKDWFFCNEYLLAVILVITIFMEVTAQKGKGDRVKRTSDHAQTRDLRSIAEFQPRKPRRPVEIPRPPSPLCTGPFFPVAFSLLSCDFHEYGYNWFFSIAHKYPSIYNSVYVGSHYDFQRGAQSE